MLTAQSRSIQGPMTADEFISWDQDTPATEELSEDWEKDLVQRQKEGLPAETDPSDEEPEQEPEPEQLRLKTHIDTMDILGQCELCGLEKSVPQEFLDTIRHAQDVLQHHVIKVKSQSKQVTLDSFVE